jgi:integrase
MPRRTNLDAGISVLTSGKVRARITHRGKNFEQTFATKTAAKRWRASMLSDLDRLPAGVTLVRNLWLAEVESPSGLIAEKFRFLDDAIVWLSTTRTGVATGEIVADDRANQTLNEFVAVWETSRVGASDRTVQRYKVLLRNQILPTLGESPIRRITRNDVKSWVNDLLSANETLSNIEKSIALLRQMMNVAIDLDLLGRNPVGKIELPRVMHKEQKALSLEQLISLSEEIGDFKSLILVLGLMGLRIGEARALKIEDVDFERSMIHVRRSFTIDSKYRRVEGATKTKQKRTVPMPAPIAELLKVELAGRPKTDWVFKGAKGDALNDGWFRKNRFKPAVRKLGLDGITIHNLRHTCASLLIRLKNPITNVSRILGHSTVVQTLNTYGHFYQEDIEDSMATLGNAFRDVELSLELKAA